MVVVASTGMIPENGWSTVSLRSTRTLSRPIDFRVVVRQRTRSTIPISLDGARIAGTASRGRTQ